MYDNDYANDVGLSSDDGESIETRPTWYKGEKGRTDRVAIVYFHRFDTRARLAAGRANPSTTEDELKAIAQKAAVKRLDERRAQFLTDAEMLDISEVQFRRAKVVFSPRVGSLLSLRGRGTAADDKVWASLGEERTVLSTLLLVYSTNRGGEVNREQFAHASKGEGYGTCWWLRPWSFSGTDKYNQIRQANSELLERGLSVAGYDLKLACKDTHFQRIDVSLAGPALYRQSSAFQAAVLDKAIGLYDAMSPARAMTTAELRAKLGLEADSDHVERGAELDDLLSSV